MSRGEPESSLDLADEKRLLKRLKRGDRAAFRQLYDAFSARLYRAVIFPKVGLEDVAEDVLRDTFLTAFEKIDQVVWRDRSLYYWLSRIAYNKVIDFHRANKRTERFVQGFTPYVEQTQTAPNPEAQYLAEEATGRAQVVTRALLSELNPRYRQAVELRFFEQKDREQCAETMSVTVGNFDVILFRAIRRLKTLYERQHRDE